LTSTDKTPTDKTPLRPFIGTYEEADNYLKDNEFIHGGYRINYSRIWPIIKSLFTCHNETVNIWTHLLGLIGFFCLVFYVGIGLTSHNAQSQMSPL
jgi:predicted membrane channel-forming protein YqfA (hemolysin III family)